MIKRKKSFWKRPEGITGIIVLVVLVAISGLAVTSFLGGILAFIQTTAGLITSLAVLGVIIFMALDGQTRSLISYMYKSTMRWITSMFVKTDPIGILKSYIDDLKGNLRKMNRQINKLRGEMHKLKEIIFNNQKTIKTNLTQATAAKANNETGQVLLKTRKAGRLKESNMKYEDLLKKMQVLYKVLSKMYDNSSILLEDIDDQVRLKEQERKAIMASHSAMKSAMSVIKGNPDKRAMFDMALEEVADDVSSKVGEMEQFMELSEGFMNSIDLQNGIFEEQGLKMLEEWEAKSDSLLLGAAKEELLILEDDVLDLDERSPQIERNSNSTNQYDSFFD